MFLPRSKYEIKQATWGMFQASGSADGKYYVGPYIEDYLGRTFAGTDILKAEERVLIRVNVEESSRRVATKVEIAPSEEDRRNGYWVRYFRQNIDTKVVEEIDSSVANSSNRKYWKVISGLWITTGNLDDQIIYGYKYRGVRYRNQKQLDLWNREIVGLSELLELKPEDFVKEN